MPVQRCVSASRTSAEINAAVFLCARGTIRTEPQLWARPCHSNRRVINCTATAGSNVLDDPDVAGAYPQRQGRIDNSS